MDLSFMMLHTAGLCVLCIVCVLRAKTDAAAAQTREPCQDTADAEVVSRFGLPSCSAARSVCGEAPTIRQACPHTCGECDRGKPRVWRRAQSATPHELSGPEPFSGVEAPYAPPSGRHSAIYHLDRNRGRTFWVSWSFGNVNGWTWSASKGEWEGFIPNLLRSLFDELGMRFVFEPPPKFGEDAADFLAGRLQAFGPVPSFIYRDYGRNVSLTRAFGVPAVQLLFQKMPKLPAIDIDRGDPWTIMLRK